MPKFRTPYEPDYNPEKYGIEFDPDDRAQQQFKDECDINTLFAKYAATGTELPINKNQPLFDADGDYLEYADYRDNQHKLIDAMEAFMQLPSLTRKYYDNDPLKMLEAVAKNDQSIYDLGLAEKPQKITSEEGVKRGKHPPSPPSLDV